MPWLLILKYAKQFLPYIIVAVIIGGGVLYWQHLERTVDRLKVENKDLVVERDAWKTSFGKLEHGLEEQKKLLETVAKQGAQLKSEFGKLNSSVKERIGSINTTLSEIKNQDLSKLSDKQAIDYLRGAATKKKGTPK
ncbi:hypothetical protein E4H12_10820 [Candidatus Thorarchaeota archaeon]|nr:MAG: hypothetical protein E4H12_10820 [Candidatus Thorarchaeota archaeon]